MAEVAASRSLLARAIAWALTLKPVRAFLLYSEHKGPMLADSVTYRTLFSVFAGVLLGFSVAGLWLAGDPEALRALVDAVDAAIPGLFHTADGQAGIIDPSDIRIPAGLTVTSVLSIIGLVGAAIGAIGSLRTALHVLADRVRDDVLWIWVLLRNLALAIGIGAALAASAALTVAAATGVNVVSGWLGLSRDDPAAVLGGRILSIAIVFVLDAVVIAVLFRSLSGLRPSARSLCSGALLGAVGLVALQELSGLFIGGAASNPLLASFASLIALLVWLNLSAQVILIASAYIVVGVEEEHDRVRARYGASTFAQRRVRRAEEAVRIAGDELRGAQEAEERERTDAAARSLRRERIEIAGDDTAE